jgi:2-phosphosulfolactate phosphatase
LSIICYTTTRQVRVKLDVIVSPSYLKEDTLEGCLCAVVDVLRATSSIITALVSGAKEVRPCLSADEARKKAARLPKGNRLLGGEEMGELIPGFDLGNSPFEYLSKETVANKIIYFYTTNGSGAIRKAFAGSGSPVYIAALLNLSAVSAAMVKKASEDKFEGIGILCAGRKGETSEEDNFCAGLMVDRISRGLKGLGIATELGDTASAAARYALSNRGHGLDVLRESVHGQYLDSLGFSDDLVFASRMDFYDAVPIFDGKRIILSLPPRA